MKTIRRGRGVVLSMVFALLIPYLSNAGDPAKPWAPPETDRVQPSPKGAPKWEDTVPFVPPARDAVPDKAPAFADTVSVPSASDIVPKSNQASLADAIEMFPVLGIPGSFLDKLFVGEVGIHKKFDPSFFNNSDWPLFLAMEIAPGLGIAPERIAVVKLQARIAALREQSAAAAARQSAWAQAQAEEKAKRQSRDQEIERAYASVLADKAKQDAERKARYREFDEATDRSNAAYDRSQALYKSIEDQSAQATQQRQLNEILRKQQEQIDLQQQQLNQQQR